MGTLTTDGIFYYVDGQFLDIGVVVRWLNPNTNQWMEGKVGSRPSPYSRCLITDGGSLHVEQSDLLLNVGDTLEIVNEVELYNRAREQEDAVQAKYPNWPWLDHYIAD